MTYTAFVHVTAAPYGDYDTYFFDEKIVVSSDSVGETLDLMVEASYAMYAKVKEYVASHLNGQAKPEDYWYVTAGYPSALRYPSVDGMDSGGGSAMSNWEDVIRMVVIDRDYVARQFLEGYEVKSMRDGHYTQYLSFSKVNRPTGLLHEEKDISTWREQGYTGSVLETVIAAMGKEYNVLLRDLDKYYSLIYGSRHSTQKSPKSTKTKTPDRLRILVNRIFT